MIINTGSRTDIPAFYSDWFIRRIEEGFVMVRNPYAPEEVIRYRLDPEVVDVISFCTKNPAPMVPHLDKLKDFRMFWNVTITPYGRDIEPGIKDKQEVITAFQKLADKIGKRATCWRYDPIFISEKYSIEYHLRAFEKIASQLQGHTEMVVISFIDLYEKTKKNFPEVTEVSWENQQFLAKHFVEIAERHEMKVYACLEDRRLQQYGINVTGCQSQQVIERAIGEALEVPGLPQARKGCSCLLGADIGVYNTCSHFCRYCYANYSRETVIRNRSLHDPSSPLLIGRLRESDKVRDAVQKSWIPQQIRLW